MIDAPDTSTITWMLLAYILLKDIIAPNMPEYMKFWNKRLSTEDRLFAIIEKSNEAQSALSITLTRLEEAFRTLEKTLDNRLARLEQAHRDQNTE